MHSHGNTKGAKDKSQPSISLAQQGNSERQNSLIVISLMHSHGNSGPSEQQAAIRSMLYGSTHVQGLGGPSVVQHVGLCRMAEPDCIHYLGKGQHAPPLQHNKHSLILRAARYNAWLLIKLTPKEGFLAPASFLFFSFLFFSFLFFSFLFLSCLFLSFLVFSFLFFSFLPYPQLSHCFPDLTGLSVLLGRSSFAFVQQYKDLEESKAVVSFAPVTKHVCSVAGDLCCGALQEACNMISSVLQVLILADTATQTFCKRMHTHAHKSLVAYTVPREVSHHKLLEILCLSMRNMDYGKHCL